jgi:hypothetical protein
MLVILLAITLHFKDKVEVVSGFYKGCSGTVERQVTEDLYAVSLNNCKGESFGVYLDVSVLKKIGE